MEIELCKPEMKIWPNTIFTITKLHTGLGISQKSGGHKILRFIELNKCIQFYMQCYLDQTYLLWDFEI